MNRNEYVKINQYCCREKYVNIYKNIKTNKNEHCCPENIRLMKINILAEKNMLIKINIVTEKNM